MTAFCKEMLVMIAFVTWPPLLYYYKGGEVTKPIIVVKMRSILLYIIQVLMKTFNFLYLT